MYDRLYLNVKKSLISLERRVCSVIAITIATVSIVSWYRGSFDARESRRKDQWFENQNITAIRLLLSSVYKRRFEGESSPGTFHWYWTQRRHVVVKWSINMSFKPIFTARVHRGAFEKRAPLGRASQPQHGEVWLLLCTMREISYHARLRVGGEIWAIALFRGCLFGAARIGRVAINEPCRCDGGIGADGPAGAEITRAERAQRAVGVEQSPVSGFASVRSRRTTAAGHCALN